MTTALLNSQLCLDTSLNVEFVLQAFKPSNCELIFLEKFRELNSGQL